MMAGRLLGLFIRRINSSLFALAMTPREYQAIVKVTMADIGVF